MTLRADVIKLPANCPLGAVSIDALANFDLIVVTGPNGAGKSTLIEPLRKPNVANGTVSCVDEETKANVAYEARGVQQSITFITSPVPAISFHAEGVSYPRLKPTLGSSRENSSLVQSM